MKFVPEEEAMTETYRCPTCRRDVNLSADRKLPIHMAKPGKPAAGGCPGSLLPVVFVSGGRVR